MRASAVLLFAAVHLLAPLLLLCSESINHKEPSPGLFLIRPPTLAGVSNVSSSSKHHEDNPSRPTIPPTTKTAADASDGSTLETDTATSPTGDLDLLDLSTSNVSATTSLISASHDITQLPAQSETFPEFFPVENTTDSTLLGGTDDVSVAGVSSDGGLPDIPLVTARPVLKLSQPSPTHPSTTHHFREIDRRLMTSQVPALNTTAFPPRILSNITTDSTENNTLDTTTRNPLGLYKYRESRILDTPVTEENQPDASNFTSWQLPFLPERRNEEEAGKMDAMEKRLEGHPEGWTPFTIPHDLLPKFLFSTLMMEPLTSTTGYHSTVTKPSMSTSKYLDQTDKLSTIFEEESTGDTPSSTIRINQPRRYTATSRNFNGLPSTDSLTADMTPPPAPSVIEITETWGTTGTTTGADEETTHPKPMIFWSDKPGQMNGRPRHLFEDEGTASELSANSVTLKDAIDGIPKQNLSREALDNLITILMKYVGQPDLLFNSTDKKTLAEIIFWPIIYQSTSSSVYSEVDHNQTTTTYDPRRSSNNYEDHQDAPPSDVSETPWPILKFIAPTPKLVDTGVWVVTAYAVYKDANSNRMRIMPRSNLLTLVQDSELKLMTKMNLQLSRVFPGLPTGPFNATDRDSKSEYHPLFERFSSLFIPLIVLAAICAFVATITVVCLVKKAQTAKANEKENKEKILHPVDVMGVENPISDELMKAGERPTPLTNGGAHHTAPMSAKEMYETEGWPADRHRYPNGHGRRLPDEEDTKL